MDTRARNLPRSIAFFMLISWYGEVPPVVRIVVTPAPR